MNTYKLLRTNDSGKLQLTDFTIEQNVPDQLKRFQEIVGGYIEIPYISEYLADHRIDIIINEEGKILELPMTALVTDGTSIVDVICGNVIFASTDDDGNTIGLTPEQITIVENLPKTMMGLQIPFRKE